MCDLHNNCSALTVLQHLLKFMNSQHESLRRELLLSQAVSEFNLDSFFYENINLPTSIKGISKENFVNF